MYIHLSSLSDDLSLSRTLYLSLTRSVDVAQARGHTNFV